MAPFAVPSASRSPEQLQTLRKTRKHYFLEGIYTGPRDDTPLPRGGQHSVETSGHEANLALIVGLSLCVCCADHNAVLGHSPDNGRFLMALREGIETEKGTREAGRF
jgi:hypothetical protein